MISVNNLSVEFSSKPLFSEITFFINPTDHIALVGKNGAGKSTLLKILAGIENPSAGVISKPDSLTVGYLPQQMKIEDDTTLLEETKKVFSSYFLQCEELKEINKKISETEDHNNENFYKLLERADYLSNLLSHENIEDKEAELEKTLLGLGFKKTDFDRKTSEFSGGWRMRIELAKILLKKPDILLLDEPTNHLDIESIQWLENFLKSKSKALILVSHDRAFLDNVTSRTIEISCGKIYDYKVSYSDFVNLRNERVQQQIRAYEKQQKEIADIKDFIERFRYKATKAVQVQSRIKQLEKIIPIEIDEVDNSHINIKFPQAERSGDYPIIIEKLNKSYGEHVVLKEVNLTIRRGDKVAFVGKNGEGKSTLVKCIINEVNFSGNLKIGHNIKIGYFAQNQAQTLDENLTVFETIDLIAVGDIRNRLNDLLGAFLFRGEDTDKKVKVLSGGEKTRLALIKLLLEPYNLLILDEPTNHLDITTKDLLKKALLDFNGTLIIVSHDRQFLDGLVNKVYEFGNTKVIEHLGGIYDFLNSKKIEDLKDLEKNKNEGLKNPEKSSAPVESKGYILYQQTKEKEKKLKRLQKDIKSCEDKISVLENDLKEVENKIGEGDSAPETLNRYSTLNEELASEMEKWEMLQNELEIFKSNND